MKFLLKNELTIAFVAALLFIPFIGVVHLFDWDEINFAESAREMIASGDYFSVQIDYERFYEKPPLFFWLQVLSMKIFGVNEFAARFPNAICGMVTLIVLFRIGKKLFNEHLARIWVMVYLGTFFTFLYFKTGIIDPWFNLFLFLSIYNLYVLSIKEESKRSLHSFYAGLFIGLAVLTKGPVAIIIIGLCFLVYLISTRFRPFINWKEGLIIIFTAACIGFLWFGVDLVQNGTGFINNFIQYHVRLLTTSEAGHGQPFFYHWWVLLLGCFPASLFFMQGMFTKAQMPAQSTYKKWMMILFWVTLLLFSIVKTKIVHYSSLCWFPLTFLAALCLYELRTKNFKLHRFPTVLLAIIGFLISLVMIAIPFIMRNKDKWVHKIDDVFARGNLNANVQWHWYDSMGGFILLSGILIYFFTKKQEMRTAALFISVTACSMITSILLVPKIEAISQRANIEFFENLKGVDCYTATAHYRSYAPFFYSQKMPHQSKTPHLDSLLYGNIDKPAFISTKIQNKAEMDTIPGLELMYEKNGFVFYKRSPAIKK